MRILITACLLALVACEPSSSSRVSIDLSGLHDDALSHGPFERLDVTVTAPDLATPVVASVDASSNAFTLNVASGKARKFTLRALRKDTQANVDVPVYWGTTTVDLAPGDVEVVIEAYAVAMLKGHIVAPAGVTLPATYDVQIETARALPGLPQTFATPVANDTFLVTVPVGGVLVSGSLSVGGVELVLTSVQSVLVTQGSLTTATFAFTQAVSNLVVEPLFPLAGADLNDWVQAGSDVACTGDDGVACEHGGERRVVRVPELTACAGWTARDSLGAFDWICDTSEGSVRFTSRFKPGRGITDLIDFNAATGPALLANQVYVESNGFSVVSESTVWWSNFIDVVDDDSGAPPKPGNITVFTSTTGAMHMSILADSSTILIVAPSTELVGQNSTEPAAAIRVFPEVRFVWAEGRFRGGAGQPAIETSGAFTMVRRFALTAESESWGLSIYLGHDNVVEGGTVTAAGYVGIHVDGAPRTYIGNVEIDGASVTGLHLAASSDGSVVEDVRVVDGVSDGIVVGSANVSLRRVALIGNDYNGLYETDGARQNRYEKIMVIANGADGMGVCGSGTEIHGVYAAANGYAGLSIASEAGRVLVVDDVVAHNNGQLEPAPGVVINSFSNARVSNVLSTNNNGSGLELGSSHSVITDATLANNGGAGLMLGYFTSGNAFVNVASVNNAVGVDFTESSGSTFFRLASVGNDAEVSNIQSLDNVFNDFFWSGTGGCTNPPIGMFTDCAAGAGDAVSVNSLSGGELFVISVDDDATNPFDGAGATAVSALENSPSAWQAFETPYRAWGRFDATGTFPTEGQQGACDDTCQVFDWRARATTGLETPAPTEFFSHVWSSGEAFDTASCQLEAPGSEWDDGCVTRFLVGTVERRGDDAGNEDGLCSTGEACVLSPNVGAYQGEGALVPVSSEVVEITSLSAYETTHFTVQVVR